MDIEIEKLTELQDRWAHTRGYNPFVRDGILSPEAWMTAKPRILFLMKESHKKANWYNISGSPIEIIARNGKFPIIWRNIVRWRDLIKSVYTGNASSSQAEYDAFDSRYAGTIQLSDIAYVNVSKELGETTSSQKLIQQAAIRDKEFLTEQIDLICPDVILCANTFWSYHAAYHPSTEFTCPADRIFIHRKRLVIKFSHPSPPGGNKEKVLHDELAMILAQPVVRSFICKEIQ
ncbi:MAG: hypothetical protein SFY80_07860 [Verrucomicrobiota bacterium]|nr:hypothetical protein [Verrucomicrobiota bacterium]